MKRCSVKRNPAAKNSRKGKDVKNVPEERKWLKLIKGFYQEI
jgi:hypothetical protein